ncbi:SDR family NAD(P)-dependent oxidoreductase [Actinoplanes sp. TRM 88003]|uniref:SDR family NAD(P)-dependent oxidoreductase n=1 Tax=Paractinoplanes aksuensis TaxID=2939490 RepID=A0ABT1DKN1_9ACTN|nr:SDR family NAD(P)-dependent oxidoreductase [Actinoplanes aksuensis]MCO8270326.1 SDR family NAD(P)-dependent oxidoreductase [Actinoplanes aksuensis]
MSKTIVIFGAGTGLGASVARRFGREGYRVALVARTRERLEALAAELSEEGIEAAAFPADLAASDGIAAVIEAVLARFGRIDVVEYAPITVEGFTAAADLSAARLRPYTEVFLLSLVEAVHAALPGMLERGDGAILLGQGVSATHPQPGLSGFGPVMAAARNYIHSLHGELAGKGVYAGVVHVAAMVERSAGQRAMLGGDMATGLDVSAIPVIDPDDIAEAFWTMVTKRDEIERQLPSS